MDRLPSGFIFSRSKIKSKSMDKQTVTSDFSDIFAEIPNATKITISKNVCDNCCFIIICPTHKHMLLRKHYVFFPYVALNSMKTWYEASLEAVLNLLIGGNNPARLQELKQEIPFSKFACMQILRFQLPQTQRFITRLIYFAELKPGQHFDFCTTNNNKHYAWYPIHEAISNKIEKVWGPEVSYFTNTAINNDNGLSITVIEYSLNDAFKYIPRETPITEEDQLLSSTNVTVNDIERLYADFIEHCFPSFFFTRFSFKIFMLKHQIEKDLKVINRYYSAFRFRNKQYMQFHELLLGLAAIDRRAPHEEFRFHLLFRYYDYDKDEALNYQEFRRLLLDAGKLQQIPSSQVKNLMRRIGTTIINNEEKIKFEELKQAILKGLIRGTSNLCRSALSPFGQITRSLATMKLCTPVSNKKLKKIIMNTSYQGVCNNCKMKKYEISHNMIILDYKGFMKETVMINDEKNLYKNSLLYYILKEIHKFNKVKDNPKNQRGLFGNLSRTEIQAFSEDFKIICSEVGDLVEKEDRVLKIDDPVYVIGDIHGNLEDLLSLEHCLWKTFPLLTSHYLFLGDYVDRGRWGFECFLYLMVAKYLAPNKIFLLRGNHELRNIQRKYSFHKELTKKYGNLYGDLFFDLINEVFDRLPFCAVIGNSIYCAHGGLPFTEQSLEKLCRETPHVVRDPEHEAIQVWEIVWSDPLEFSKFSDTAKAIGVSVDYMNGLFLPNVKRGTSYFYNEYAVVQFFKDNNLKYMIRAHEVPASGFKFNFGTLCTTVFSCSHYCGADNECAVVFLDRESRIRLIRIDTSMNMPAT